MKTKNIILLFTLIFVIGFSTKSFSQFEQKFTLQVAWGLLQPQGDFGDYFYSGFTFDAGAQYNINRSFAIVGLAKYGTLFSDYDEETDEEWSFTSLGISICPKYRFFPTKKINPYILGGVSASFTSYTGYIEGEEETYENPVSFGYTAGVGIDWSISEHFALFLQGGYSSCLLNDEDFDNFNNTYIQAGLNISFAKSKSL